MSQDTWLVHVFFVVRYFLYAVYPCQTDFLRRILAGPGLKLLLQLLVVNSSLFFLCELLLTILADCVNSIKVIQTCVSTWAFVQRLTEISCFLFSSIAIFFMTNYCCMLLSNLNGSIRTWAISFSNHLKVLLIFACVLTRELF